MRNNKKWTVEELQTEANKYQTRGEFQRKDINKYSASHKRKLIDELFKNHKNKGYTDKQKISGYWTKEKLQIEANKYETRNEFRENKSVYGAAKKKKLLNIIFKNHQNEGYSDKKDWKEDNYIIYVYELTEYNRSYVGLTTDIKRRDLEHLFDTKEALNKFCIENNVPYPKYKILEENLNAINAKKQEEYWMEYYKINNWIPLNSSKAGSLGKIRIIWTKIALQNEANKYKTRGEFAKNNMSAYTISCSKKILDDLFKNHLNNGYLNKKDI